VYDVQVADLDTRTISQPGAAYQFRRARYEVVSGPDRGLQGVTEQAELTIGTDRSCDIVLTDPTVSRHHLALTSGPDGLRLRDLGSKNGTRVGRMLVESATLLGAAIVEIGATAIRFDAHRDDGSEPMAESDSWGRVLGQSAAMRRIFAVLERVAPSDATVLLEGETGTGKTLVADAIHQASPRAGKPFMVVDCGALAPSLIESELFGHERGAFTGAHEPRAGAFEAAGGGTVFLDEVGELPLDMQPKLLRALDDRAVKRIGSNAPVRIDVRVIAATNRDLRVEVNRGGFRPDLFYRLNTVRIRIPPLRERPEDLAVLVGHFHRQFRGGDPAPELVAAMSRLSWPGNVRELRSAIERAVLLDDPAMWPEAGPDPAGQAFDASLPFRAAKERVVATWERRYLADLLAETGGNLSRAARLARMDRNHLRELTRRYKLTAGDD
jgi:DNA-binding NtrC family response regulator